MAVASNNSAGILPHLQSGRKADGGLTMKFDKAVEKQRLTP
jgi:hypothetical protein